MAGFLVVVFLVAGFLAAVLVVVLAAVLVVLAAGLAVFAAAGLAPALALANLARAALRRLTVLAFKRPFLTALSYSDCALERLAGVGSALKALTAVLMLFLISWLCSVRLTAWRAAFFADLIIGMKIPYY